MMRKGKRRADVSRKLGAVVRGAEQVDRRQGHIAWHRAHIVKWMANGETARLQQHQLVEAFQEIILFANALPSAERIGRCRVGAGRAPQAEVDAPGIKRLKHLEALGHHQGRVVRQHHAAGADAQFFRNGRDLPDHDIGGRTGDGRQVMMFGHPVAPEAQPIGMPREIERIAQGLSGRGIRGNGGKIEDG